MKIRHTLVCAALAGSLLVAPTAQAADGTGRGLNEDQRAAVAQLETSTTVSTPATTAATRVTTASGLADTAATAATAATRSKRLTLYRGSFLMWARDTMNWSYNGTKVTSSSLSQEAGYVFPNVSKKKGVKRYEATSKTHKWRGNYTIGAGIVTPWGDVRVYGADYSTDWKVQHNGAGSGRWN